MIEETQVCKGCLKEKPLTEYYKAKTKSGLTGKCKDCIKSQVKAYRKDNIEKVQEYDRNRPNHKERQQEKKERKKRLKEENPELYLERERKRTKNYRSKHPEKYKAQTAVGNKLRDGIISKPEKCQHCGTKYLKLEAHHWSYEELHWLDVEWLCDSCHKKEHKRLRAEERDPDCLT